MTIALHTEGLCKSWGGVFANNEVTLALPLGARHALIGPNGAGKTTFVNLLTGLYAPSAGRVCWPASPTSCGRASSRCSGCVRCCRWCGSPVRPSAAGCSTSTARR